jgi:hypothetical protein
MANIAFLYQAKYIFTSEVITTDPDPIRAVNN